MGFSWTKAQQKVIRVRDCNVLVSAAAGSGKTAVLVERILELIMDKNNLCNIDDMVIVTFTKAAANEMKQRIVGAFEARLEAEPGNHHLEKQIALIHQANITTIHGFCKDIIENHFYLLDLEPGFRIGEEAEMELLRKDVLDQVLVEAYGEGKPEFFSYIDRYAPGKNDLQIEEQITKLYDFAMGNPFPEDFLIECIEKYPLKKSDYSSFYFEEVVRYVRGELDRCIDIIQSSLELCKEDARLDKYAATLELDLDGMIRLSKGNSYQEMLKLFQMHSFSKLGTVRSYEGDGMREYIKEVRTEVKDQVNDLKDSYFFASLEQMGDCLVRTGLMVKELVNLTNSFRGAYEKEKKKRNVIDFHDLEHYALQILVDPMGQPTQAAQRLQDKYQYIMIDEYQDSNLVQEIILNSIARKKDVPTNVFMVGDVKQSIYRFRLARPELFMEKYDRYKEDGPGEQKINLHQNFRSREEVISLVNSVFDQIMKRDLGGIEYDKDARLVPGASYPKMEEISFKSQLLVIDQDTDIELADTAQKEGIAIAEKIYDILDHDMVTDSKTGQLRKARFSDIVLLSRSLSNWVEPVKEILEQYGIPVFSTLTTGYFSSIEIQTILAMLHLVDNFMQDIPLVTVLTSEMFCFSKEDLAQIKASSNKKFFHQVFLDCLEEKSLVTDELREKMLSFYQQIQSYQKMSSYFSIHELISRILDDTFYLDCVTAMPKGNIRRMNLFMLVEKAVQFENTSYKGVFHFLRYMERLEKYEIDFGSASTIGEMDNVVRIMSTHKSKGLEFPIVIVANLGKLFNISDKRDTLVLHPRLGIGLADVDSDLRIKRETISKNLMKDYLGNENVGEELRILYVALTRAKEKLYMMGGIKKIEKFQDKMIRKADYSDQMNYLDRKSARTPMNWIYPALCCKSCCEIQVIRPNPDIVIEQMKKRAQLAEDNILLNEPSTRDDIEDAIMDLDHRFQYTYPYRDEFSVKAKMSVSEIKHRFMEARYMEAEDIHDQPAFLPTQQETEAYIPKFAGGIQKENKGAFHGTAIHRYLELFNYEILSNIDEEQLLSGKIEEDMKKRFLEGLISQEQMESLTISVKDMVRFFKSRLGTRMAEAFKNQMLFREQPFVMGVDPIEAGIEMEGTMKILVQGMIDAYFEEDGKLVLVDYKTDRVRSEQELLKRYEKQMELYKKALENGTGKPVKEVILYSFSLQKPLVIL